MNAYEIEQIEKQMRCEVRLPLPYQAWGDIERQARQQRARVMGRLLADFFSAALAKISGVARQVRSTAAHCTEARLRHDH